MRDFRDPDLGVVSFGHQRKCCKLNIPLGLDTLMVIYMLFALFFTGDGAIRGRNPDASISTTSWHTEPRHQQIIHDWTPTLVKELMEYVFGAPNTSAAPSASHTTRIPVGNAFADLLLLLFPDSMFLWLLHAIPDGLMALFLGNITIICLRIAALGDPGFIPRSWGEEALRRAPAVQQQTAVTVVDEQQQQQTSTVVIEKPQEQQQQSKDVSISSSPLFSGCVVSPASPAVTQSAGGVSIPGWTYCERCDLWRPPRGHHDKMSGKCVYVLDHFCSYSDSTIGIRNYKCFALFLFYIMLVQLHAWAQIIRFFFAESIIEWVKSSPFLMVLTLAIYVLVFGLTFFCAGFLCGTVWHMMKDETALEHMIRTAPRYSHQAAIVRHDHQALTESDDDDEDGGNGGGAKTKKNVVRRWCYAKPRRWFKNVHIFMGPSVWKWLVPTLLDLPNPFVNNKVK